jgi:hypothetical protein
LFHPAGETRPADKRRNPLTEQVVAVKGREGYWTYAREAEKWMVKVMYHAHQPANASGYAALRMSKEREIAKVLAPGGDEQQANLVRKTDSVGIKI